jgi:hypothetical protein
MQVKMFSEKLESRKATLIAHMMEEFMNEEKKITSQFDNDPIAKLKARELDLMAQENSRKEQEGKDRINLDKMKTMMNQVSDHQKLAQNDHLSKLRANTSIEKTILAAKLKQQGQ